MSLTFLTAAPVMTRSCGAPYSGTFQHLDSSRPPNSRTCNPARAPHSSNQICKTGLRCGSLNVSTWLLFPALAAGTRFQLLCVKRATRSISRQHPSQILRSILRPITHPGSKTCRLARRAQVAHQQNSICAV